MAVPKKQTTSRRSKLRRSHNALTEATLAKCPKCGELVAPHNACTNCGYYGDKKVLDIKTKLDKKLQKSDKGSAIGNKEETKR